MNISVMISIMHIASMKIRLEYSHPNIGRLKTTVVNRLPRYDCERYVGKATTVNYVVAIEHSIIIDTLNKNEFRNVRSFLIG